MICKKCGARLLKSDLFCVKCGTKISPEKKCKSCGVILRDGVLFCPNCGVELTDDMVEEVLPSDDPEDEDIPVTRQVKTEDIPFDLIEETIIKEASRRVLGEKATEDSFGKNTESDENIGGKNTSELTEEQNPEKKPATPEKKDEDESKATRKDDKEKQFSKSYDEYADDDDYSGEFEEFDSEEGYGDYEDEYDDGYDEGYEESYEDYPEEYEEKESLFDFLSGKLLTVLIIVAGLIFVIILAAIFFTNRASQKADIEQRIEETVENEETEEEEPVKEATSIVKITSNVNVRDNPRKDDSNVLQVAKEGEEYPFLGYGDSSENWIRIKLPDGSEGYIFKDYAQIIDQ